MIVGLIVVDQPDDLVHDPQHDAVHDPHKSQHRSRHKSRHSPPHSADIQCHSLTDGKLVLEDGNLVTDGAVRARRVTTLSLDRTAEFCAQAFCSDVVVECGGWHEVGGMEAWLFPPDLCHGVAAADGFTLDKSGVWAYTFNLAVKVPDFGFGEVSAAFAERDPLAVAHGTGAERVAVCGSGLLRVNSSKQKFRLWVNADGHTGECRVSANLSLVHVGL
jgi:hypothetical protein